MEIKMGAIVIGSLLWDLTEIRKKWQNELLLEKKHRVRLPIRYGRLSEKNRQGTYTMVFSNNINDEKTKGFGYVIPYKNNITSNEEFVKHIKLLADAEGISDNHICKNWGTVCISINPYIDKIKKQELTKLWNNLVNDTKSSLKEIEQPKIEKFGEESELKSIDHNWNLTIDLDNLFKNELRDFDCLIATSNAVKLNSNRDNLYPTFKQIANAIKHKNYYRYFLENRQNNIRTFQDKNIAKVLKRKYRISLKDKLKTLKQEISNKTVK
ncbi:hypothetical protein [Mesoflavibacter sp. CH_XMU1404-2]|uniref:hypothetical protein n=1 Tax=Mesoflavibacter sp. CH_XMU1404-2 TaxID=3107766 RepID=UPI003007FD40